MKTTSAITRWILCAAFVVMVVVLVFTLYPSILGIRVSEVTDGDTIVLNNGNVVRYIGIDTPEQGDSFFAEATETNRRLVRGKKLRLEYDIDKRDRYGRVLAYVWVDSLLVNAELIRRGLASVYLFSPNLKYRDDFVSLQKEARGSQAGIWSVVVSEEEYYVASRKSKRFVFHRADCQWAEKIREQNRMRFHSRGEALDSGYASCRTCKP